MPPLLQETTVAIYCIVTVSHVLKFRRQNSASQYARSARVPSDERNERIPAEILQSENAT
jgi:hypothetical protein